MLTIEQCRAARGLLDWTQQDLADASGLSKTAINNFEKNNSSIKSESLRAIYMAFMGAGLEFLGEKGLQRKEDESHILKGAGALGALLDDIYETLKAEEGAELLISHIEERTTRHISQEKLHRHLADIHDLRRSIRLIGSGNLSNDIMPLEAKRGIVPDEAGVKTRLTTFIYHEKVAFELWDQSMIIVVNSPEASNAERLRFEKVWASAAKHQDDVELFGTDSMSA